ncbi:MAG: spore germination protein [Clostridiales bacterium]|jgi:hypothetical protein|nr:spore germination protein [Clostridiales bacterium]
MTTNTKQLNRRQFVCLILLLGTASKIIALPTVLADAAGKDAWISALLDTALFCVPLALILAAYILARGKSLDEVFNKTAGAWVAKTVYALLFLVFVAHTAMQCGENRAFLDTALYTGAPWALYSVPLILLLAFAAYKGLNGLGRFAELLVPLALAALVCTALSAFSNYRFYRVLPVLERGFRPVWRGALDGMFWYAEELCLLLFLGEVDGVDGAGIAGSGRRLPSRAGAPKKQESELLNSQFSILNSRKGFARAAFIAYAAAGLAVAGFMAAFLMLFGTIAGRHDFGGALSGFADLAFTSGAGKLGGLFSAVWLAATLLKMAVTFFCAHECLLRLFKPKNAYFTLIPLAAFTWVFNNFIVPDLETVKFWVSAYSVYVVPAVTLAIPAACLLCAALYKRKVRKGNGELRMEN